MGEVIRFDRGERDAVWAVERLDFYAANARILGFAFHKDDKEVGTTAILPDEITLRDLLMARAIIDETIMELIKENRV